MLSGDEFDLVRVNVLEIPANGDPLIEFVDSGGYTIRVPGDSLVQVETQEVVSC